MKNKFEIYYQKLATLIGKRRKEEEEVEKD